MLAKKLPGSPETDPDDAPELTVEMLDRAEVFDGDRFVRRGRGRPPLDTPKEKINVRLDAAVVERLRASGPGWQTRVNTGMAMLTGVDRRLLDWIDLCIANNENEIEFLKDAVERMEAGVQHSFMNDRDVTELSLERDRNSIETRAAAIEIMRETQRDLLGPYLVDKAPSQTRPGRTTSPPAVGS